MSRSAWLVPTLALLAACRGDTPLSTRDPDVVVVNPQIWTGAPLRLVSPAFGARPPLVFTVDDTVVTDTSRLAFVGADTLVLSGFWYVGWHTVAVRLGERRPPAMRFEVHGFHERGTDVRLVGRPLAVGQGSSSFWVGTSRGLAILDARWPAREPELVDSTVDVSCLWSLSALPGGGVVTADRGCGTIRARRYGAVTVEVDSGPRAVGWHHAVNGRPGVWLMVGSDSAGVAVRQGDGTWRWSFYRWSNRATRVLYADDDNPPEVSPDGRLAVVGRARDYPDFRADVLVFDLENGSLLFRQDSAYGPAVAFSPTGDTMAAFEDSNLILLEGRTGRRLASFPALTRDQYGYDASRYWGPLAWDPYGPWLDAWTPNGCPGLLAVDRRTWSRAGRLWHVSSDILECDGAIALSGFTRTGWVLQLWYQGDYPYVIVPFNVPDP